MSEHYIAILSVIALSDQLVQYMLSKLMSCRRSTITGLDQWTGLVDWTGGLIRTIRKLVPMHEF